MGVLDGKVAIVTGATSGIGARFSQATAGRGEIQKVLRDDAATR